MEVVTAHTPMSKTWSMAPADAKAMLRCLARHCAEWDPACTPEARVHRLADAVREGGCDRCARHVMATAHMHPCRATTVWHRLVNFNVEGVHPTITITVVLPSVEGRAQVPYYVCTYAFVRPHNRMALTCTGMGTEVWRTCKAEDGESTHFAYRVAQGDVLGPESATAHMMLDALFNSCADHAVSFTRVALSMGRTRPVSLHRMDHTVCPSAAHAMVRCCAESPDDCTMEPCVFTWSTTCTPDCKEDMAVAAREERAAANLQPLCNFDVGRGLATLPTQSMS